MVDINWGILRPVDIGGAFNQGVEAGRQRRAENALDEQFRTMAQNPNAPVSNDLLRFAPRQAYQLSQQQRQQQKGERERDVKMRAAQGDKAAIAELAGIDLEEYRQLRGDQREAAKQGIDTIGQLALMAFDCWQACASGPCFPAVCWTLRYARCYYCTGGTGQGVARTARAEIHGSP